MSTPHIEAMNVVSNVTIGQDGNGNSSGDDDDDDDDDDDGADYEAALAELMCPPEERFDEDCEMLRANSPKKVHVDTRELDGYGAQLGQALVGNTQVKSFFLILSNEAVNGPGHWQRESTDLLFDYIQRGPSLNGLIVHGGNYPWLNGPLFLAVANNPNIETLMLKAENRYREEFAIPPQEFAHLLRTTPSLKTLTMDMVNDMVVAEGFGANQTLEVLRLDYDPVKTNNGAVLLHLRSHPKLERLELMQGAVMPRTRSIDTCNTVQFDDALVKFLKGTQSLKHLSLSDHSFDKVRLIKWIQGLHLNTSLTHMTVIGGRFEKGAVDAWSRMVNGKAFSHKHANTSIQEVEIVDCYSDPPTRDKEAGLLAVTCRQLQVLKRRWRNDRTRAAGFWGTLQTSASTSVIREMWLENYNLRLALDPSMATCLPLYRGLQELHFNSSPDEDYYGTKLPDGFAAIVKRSGSLLKITSNDRPARSKSTAESREVKAALERNRRLPQLLRLSLAVASCHSEDLQQQQQQQPVEPVSGVAAAAVWGPALPPLAPLLAPTLSMAATQAPFMAQSWMLKGLLGLRRRPDPKSPSFEQNRRGKRKCANDTLEAAEHVTKKAKDSTE